MVRIALFLATLLAPGINVAIADPTCLKDQHFSVTFDVNTRNPMKNTRYCLTQCLWVWKTAFHPENSMSACQLKGDNVLLRPEPNLIKDGNGGTHHTCRCMSQLSFPKLLDSSVLGICATSQILQDIRDKVTALNQKIVASQVFKETRLACSRILSEECVTQSQGDLCAWPGKNVL
jgi:hypothetical protein